MKARGRDQISADHSADEIACSGMAEECIQVDVADPPRDERERLTT